MDHFDISFVIWKISRSRELTKPTLLDPAHLPGRLTRNARAQQVQSDTEKRAHDLDLMYPGSMFTQVLKAHGKDVRYLVLVVGPFVNLSGDFMVLCEFL